MTHIFRKYTVHVLNPEHEYLVTLKRYMKLCLESVEAIRGLHTGPHAGGRDYELELSLVVGLVSWRASIPD